MQIPLAKEQIRDELGISLATVNNWIKTGIIPPPDLQNGYSETTYDNIMHSIKSNNLKLNGRANRSQLEQKFISFLGITDRERKNILISLINVFENSGLSISDGVLSLSISILIFNKLISQNWQYNPQTRIEKLLCSWLKNSATNSEKIIKLYSSFNIINENDDIIGAFYQSIQSISQKSTLGSYYTPSELLTDIWVSNNKTILDPCCGSGGMLLRIISKEHDSSLVFARDIDSIALYICHVNLALFFNDSNFKSTIITQDITQKNIENIFLQSKDKKFDFIVTNPPWGSKFSKTQKETLIKTYPELSTAEIFSIALNNCIEMLASKGNLHIFLPHSILNVATHKNIRKKILNTIEGTITIKLLGKAFKGVLSENILLNINKNKANENIYILDQNNNKYSITKSSINLPDYFISATSSDIDTNIINKIYSIKHTTLKENTTFALGIVTGNNDKHILTTKSKNNEPIYRGKDIKYYKYSAPQCFINFTPDIYQQIAPVKYFRQNKIAYRFISDRIICALDKEQSLLLNSANFFISHEYPMETIVCLFNNPIYTFIYRKKFHSNKLLKSHLQDLPLPILTENMHLLFKNNHDNIVKEKLNINIVNKIIYDLFLLNNDEIVYIEEMLNGNS